MSEEKKTAPVEAEATDSPAVIEHGGVEYLIPAPLDFPLEVVEVESEVDVLKLILGDEQWATYRATKPTIRDFQALSEKVNAASGKLMLAVYVIREHPEELEADLLDHFGVDLMDYWRRQLSLRRIGVLASALLRRHGRSDLAAVMDDTAEWNTSDYLLARISDALEVSNYLFLKANAEDSSNIEVPDPIRRPGDEEIEHVVEHASPDEIMSFFNQMNNL